MTSKTGVIGFNEETRRVFITDNDTGNQYPVSCLFEFFNGFISLKDLVARIDDEFNETEKNDILYTIYEWNVLGTKTSVQVLDYMKKTYEL